METKREKALQTDLSRYMLELLRVNRIVAKLEAEVATLKGVGVEVEQEEMSGAEKNFRAVESLMFFLFAEMNYAMHIETEEEAVELKSRIEVAKRWNKPETLFYAQDVIRGFEAVLDAKYPDVWEAMKET